MMQATVVQGPPPPVSPTGQGIVVTTRVLSGAPVTAQEIAALRARRSELSNQLTSADGRRHELSRQLKNATGADRAGLEQRIGVLDARLARLETDIDENGKQLAAAPAALTASKYEPSVVGGSNVRNQIAGDIVPITAILSIFVLGPIALAKARSIWKRGSLPRQEVDKETPQRLERMEQAMDAIAIEIERVSEGQRFVTRLLAEGKGGIPIGAGQPAMEPVPIPLGERERI